MRTKRGRTTTPILALLMVLQLFASGAVQLAHARERETAPIGIEAHHDASCVVLHDALHCALCQFARSHTLPTTAAPEVAVRPAVFAAPMLAPATGYRRSRGDSATRPRAPPTLLA